MIRSPVLRMPTQVFLAAGPHEITVNQILNEGNAPGYLRIKVAGPEPASHRAAARDQFCRIGLRNPGQRHGSHRLIEAVFVILPRPCLRHPETSSEANGLALFTLHKPSNIFCASARSLKAALESSSSVSILRASSLAPFFTSAIAR